MNINYLSLARGQKRQFRGYMVRLLSENSSLFKLLTNILIFSPKPESYLPMSPVLEHFCYASYWFHTSTDPHVHRFGLSVLPSQLLFRGPLSSFRKLYLCLSSAVVSFHYVHVHKVFLMGLSFFSPLVYILV